MNRIVVAVVGIVSSVAGVVLQLNAYDLAWPSSFSYSGLRTDTVWYAREQTYQDIGLTLFAFGLLLLLLVAARWLWPQDRQT